MGRSIGSTRRGRLFNLNDMSRSKKSYVPYMDNSSKILIYTFGTFPYKKELSKFFGDYFVFGKLKRDFEDFARLIVKDRPKLILGIARSTGNYSQFEKEAINRFNKTGIISRAGSSSYELYYPKKGYKSIGLSDKPTDSFCNWTMYKIAEYVNKLKIRSMFVHITGKDLKCLIEFLNEN